MAGFGFPRDLVTEMFLDGWQDMSTSVRQTAPVGVNRGTADEQERPSPSSLNLTLHNNDGQFTPGNPMSPWYRLLGQNTPIRCSFRCASDGFGRVTSGGWGTADVGGAWSVEGTGTPYSTDGSHALHSITGTNTYLLSYQDNVPVRNMCVTIDYTPAFSDVTGAQIEPATIVLRRLNANTYYMMRVIVTTGEAYQLQVIRKTSSGETSSSAVTVAGLTHTSGQTVRVCGMIEGRTVYGKIWRASDPEPYEWGIEIPDANDSLAWVTPGGWGIRSGVASGNSNSSPRVFTYDNLDVRILRAADEISELNPDWDETHTVKQVALRACGVSQRLRQNKSSAPVKSSLRRGHESETANPPLAYWPCEDGKGSTSIASGIPGGFTMDIIGGPPSMASSADFDCSAPLPVLRNNWLRGPVGFYAATGKVQVRMLLSIPSTGTTDGATLLRVYGTGSVGFWDFNYASTGPNVVVKAYDSAGTQLHSASYGPINEFNGSPLRMQVDMTQDGGDIDYNVSFYAVGAASGGTSGGTVTSQTLGIAKEIVVDPRAQMSGVTVGHIALYGQVDSLFSLMNEVNAWVGERAADRAVRLAAENSVPLTLYGDPSYSAPMGPQRVKALMTLLDECVDAEQGLMIDSRAVASLVFRTRHSMYVQPELLALDYSAEQVAPPLAPAIDDQGRRNDVTASREGGGSRRSTQTSGPKNINPPWEDPDGIGHYEGEISANLASDAPLKYAAGFARHLSTVPDDRYPEVTVNLGDYTITDALTADTLGVDAGDRVTVTDLTAADIYHPIDQIARGYQETLTDQYRHQVVFNASPYSPYRGFALGTDRLDTSTTTLDEDLDETETGVNIAVTVLWTTNPVDLPLLAEIDGEVVRVTAVSGSSSPQTLTVDRSVNDVVKTHSSGAAVRLAYPHYLER